MKMKKNFQANGLATSVGSLPLRDHEKAVDLIFEYTPDIPSWAQLPIHREEGMMIQFAQGLPGLCSKDGDLFVKTDSDAFYDDLLEFFEDYMAVVEDRTTIEASRFTLKKNTARGFILFLERLQKLSMTPVAVKGQITGPFTFCTGIVDQGKRAIFYEPQIKDAAVKLLALKARWQVRQLSQFQKPVLMFFDEPALAGIGSSEFTSISNEEIDLCFEEVFEAVHLEGGLAGIHVCANTDWSLVLESKADVVSFDAYTYFDRFILYPDKIKRFLESGRILAWGIVPTSNIEAIKRETCASLLDQLEEKIGQIEALGIDKQMLINQSLITPSCGAGSLSVDLAQKVLKLTREVSQEIRNL
jgi:methionine synthase II (cobalamin-independent)